MSDPSLDPLKQQVRAALADARLGAVDLSCRVHQLAETAWEEVESAAVVATYLGGAGFEVTPDAAGLPTALSATFGAGDLVVTFCAEYDALPEVGHACGHNLIAASSCLAAVALTGVADRLGITVHVLGTPAEESGGGKVRQLAGGSFDRTHLALMAHPAPADVASPGFLAIHAFDVTFDGRAAHAAAAPDRGINAADALTVAQVGIGLLRQHLPASARVHGIVTNGGEAPNVVPERSGGSWVVRSPRTEDLTGITERVKDCFRAGALATGCHVHFADEPPYDALVADPDLVAAYAANAAALGHPSTPATTAASTDMGNVSQVIPTIHPLFKVSDGPAVNHEADFATECLTAQAHQAMADAALAMAWTVVDAATDAAVRARLLDRGPGPRVF